MFFCLHISIAQEKNYTSELGKFSMSSYGEVTKDVKQNEGNTVYRAAFRHQEMLFAVSSTLYNVKVKKANSLLEASLSNFTKTVKGEKIAQKRIREQKVKGVYSKLHLKKNDVQTEYKVFYKGLHLYQVMVFAKKDKYNQRSADAFFKSFKIAK